MRLLHGRTSGGRVMSQGLSLYKPGQDARACQHNDPASPPPYPGALQPDTGWPAPRAAAMLLRSVALMRAFPNHGCGTGIAPPKDSP